MKHKFQWALGSAFIRYKYALTYPEGSHEREHFMHNSWAYLLAWASEGESLP